MPFSEICIYQVKPDKVESFEALMKEAVGKIFWIDADPKLRYERIQSGGRNRIDDRKSFEEFIDEER